MILRFHYYGTLQLTLNRRTAALLSFGCGAYGEPIHAPKPQSAANPMTAEADLWLHSHTWFHYALVKTGSVYYKRGGAGALSLRERMRMEGRGREGMKGEKI